MALPLNAQNKKNLALQQAQLKKAGIAKPTAQDAKPLPKLSTSSVPAMPVVKTPPAYSKGAVVGKTPEIYKPRYTSSQFTKPEATQVTDKLKQTQKDPLNATNLKEAEAIRVARGQIKAKAGKPGEVLPPPQVTEEVVESEADSIKKESQQYLDQEETLKKANLEGELGEENTIIQSANDRYNAEQANLTKLEDTQTKILEDRNAALASESEIKRQDAELAYETAKQEEEMQRQRTQKAFDDQIVEQKTANTKRLLAKESMLAAFGGFGSLIKNKELEETTVQNDRLMNSVVFEKNAADQEITNKITTLSKGYQLDLAKIEDDKSSSTQENYDKYLEYVTKIQGDREMSEVEKQSAIKEAASTYKKNVAKINQDSFETRHKIAQDASNEVRKIKAEEKNDARGILEGVLSTYALSDVELTPAQKKDIQALEKRAGYPEGVSMLQVANLKEEAKQKNLQIEKFEDGYGNVTIAAIDKTSGDVINQVSLQGVGRRENKYDISYNPITGEQSIIDPYTGQTIAGSGQSFSPNTPPGTQGVGSMVVPDANFKKVFNVGGVGGWCGNFASTISTARKVGDSWAEKLRAIDKRSNPKPGDKLLLPLGVRTAKGNGAGEYGHVTVVTSYDPNTGIINVIQSNANGEMNTRKGPGHITTGTFNLSTLQKQYGNNFGFASGNFKPHIADKLKIQSIPTIQNNPTGQNAGSITQADALKVAAERGIFGKEAYQFADLAVKTGILPTDLAAQKKAEEAGKEGTISNEMKTKLQNDPSVKKVKAANELQLAIKAYKDLAEKQTGLVTGGSDKTSIDAAYNNLKIQFKNAAELGAIAAADVPLIEGAIKPITKDIWDVPGRYNFENEGGVQGVLSSLDTALNISNQKKEAAAQELKSLYPEYADSDYFNTLTGSSQANQPSSNGNTIKVKLLSTGQTGSIPADKFDPAKYAKIDNPGMIKVKLNSSGKTGSIPEGDFNPNTMTKI